MNKNRCKTCGQFLKKYETSHKFDNDTCNLNRVYNKFKQEIQKQEDEYFCKLVEVAIREQE